jgi:hypothetical protein
LTLESNRPIGGLPPAKGDAAPDVTVHLGYFPSSFVASAPSVSWHESSAQNDRREPLLRIDRILATGDLWLKYADGTEFLIDASAESVFVLWPPSLTLEDALIYLLGPVTGILLRTRGRVCLHASVVAIGDAAVGFLGGPGAGKSTIAAAFERAGHKVLSDDLLVLSWKNDQPHAEPGYCSLRLWPASAEGLYGSREALPRMVGEWDKRYYDLARSDSFWDKPLPLGAIYTIGKRRSDGPPTSFGTLSRRAALIQMIVNSYAASLPGAVERRRDFEELSHLIGKVKVREMALNDDWNYLRHVPESVTRDLAETAVVGR